MSRASVAVVVVSLGLLAAACGSSSSESSAHKPAAVMIKTFMFGPNPVRIDAGTTVTWTNTDQILHTVTSGTRDDPDGMFDQKLDGQGSTASFTFQSAGTFPYHCSIHPGMDATVEVT